MVNYNTEALQDSKKDATWTRPQKFKYESEDKSVGILHLLSTSYQTFSLNSCEETFSLDPCFTRAIWLLKSKFTTTAMDTEVKVHNFGAKTWKLMEIDAWNMQKRE